MVGGDNYQRVAVARPRPSQLNSLLQLDCFVESLFREPKMMTVVDSSSLDEQEKSFLVVC